MTKLLPALLLIALACSEPEPPRDWMEATEIRFVDCFFETYKEGIAGDRANNYEMAAFDADYGCELERGNRPYEKVADFMECMEQARALFRSKYGDLDKWAIEVLEEGMEVHYPKTLCWPQNELRDLPDAVEFIPDS